MSAGTELVAVCRVGGCGRPVEARGLCRLHYRRQLAESKAALSRALDIPAAPRGIAATSTELRISRRLSVAEWEDLVDRLVYVRAGSPWWIGDAIAFGETTYGRTYAPAAKATGLSRGTLRNYASVAKRVRPEVRDPALPFRSHYLVAGLRTPEQRRWLARARKWGWTSTELAAQMRSAKLAGGPDDGFEKPPIETEYECPRCHYRFSGAPYQRRRA